MALRGEFAGGGFFFVWFRVVSGVRLVFFIFSREKIYFVFKKILFRIYFDF